MVNLLYLVGKLQVDLGYFWKGVKKLESLAWVSLFWYIQLIRIVSVQLLATKQTCVQTIRREAPIHQNKVGGECMFCWWVLLFYVTNGSGDYISVFAKGLPVHISETNLSES